MPIYAYRCNGCSHEFDTIQKMSDEPLLNCPECNQPQLAKQVTAPAFRLKGSGWYETDFKTGDKKNISHGDDKPKTGDSDKAATKATESASSNASNSSSDSGASSSSSKSSSSSSSDSKPAAASSTKSASSKTE